MAQRIRNFILASLTLSLFVVAPIALAKDGQPSTGSGSTTTTTTKPPETTEPVTDTAGINDRLAQLKTELKVKLDGVETQHIKDKCKPAQTIVKDVESRVKTNVTDRTKAYSELVDHLTGLIAKLKAKNISTTELEAELVILNTKIATFNTDLATYKQRLSDLKLVDCTTDPTAFQTALLASRTAHDKVLADATDIKTYVKGTIKVTLQAIRAQLETAEKSSTTQGGN